MSADAKIWQEDNGDWRGISDAQPDYVFKGGPYDLHIVLGDIEESMGRGTPYGMRWELNVYPDGKAGLRGYTY